MCEKHSDCFENGVFKECYPRAIFSNETNFCECSPWYGWVGERCNEFTGQNIFYALWLFIMGIWCVFILVAITRTLYYYFKFGNKTKGIDPVVYTAAYIVISSLLVLINCILNFSSVVNPKRFEFTVYKGSDEEFLTIKGGKFSGFALIIAAGCVALASLQIFVSWQNIAVQASSFGTERTKLIAGNHLLGIKVFVVFYSLFLIATAFAERVDIASVGVVLIAVFLTIGYPFAYFSLKKAFAGLKVIGDELVNRMINLIGFCAKVNAYSLLISTLSLSLFLVFYQDYEQRLTPGKFNYIVIFRDLGSLSGLFQVTVMSWYINAVANQGSVNHRWSLWKRWDFQQLKLTNAKSSMQKSDHAETYSSPAITKSPTSSMVNSANLIQSNEAVIAATIASTVNV